MVYGNVRNGGSIDNLPDDCCTEVPCLVIDMTHLDFLDSTGLGVLIHVQNRAQALGESMVLVHPPPLVRKLLLGTQLSRLFTAYETLDDALAALRAN